jgi:hypothetical protein
MKRKAVFILALLVGLLLAITPVAFARTGRGNPKGVITDIDSEAGTITIQVDEDETLTITLPDGFDYKTIDEGMFVVAKGTWIEDYFQAIWVKEEDPEEADLADGEEGGHAWGRGGIYCAGGKIKQHPMALKIAELYGVEPEWVMGDFCNGQGFGTIMLALQTSAVTGEDADDLLSTFKNGKGWGLIWKAAGLVKNDKASNPPPGWLKKLGR